MKEVLFLYAALAICCGVAQSLASNSIGYYGHPDRIEQEWLDEELKHAIPSEKALDACCNVENNGIWFKKCTIWDYPDSYCHYQNKCWALLRKIAYAGYTKKPKEIYQMIVDGAANKYKVADYVNCSRSEFSYEPVLSSCVVRSVCQRFIESKDNVKTEENKKSDCVQPLISFKLIKNKAMSDLKRCDMNNQAFKLTATDCLRSCHRARLNKVRPCMAAVFGPDGHCNMYKDRTMDEGGSCMSIPAVNRTLIEMKSYCRIR